MAWCITHESLKGICRQHKLYEHRKELNDVLYLHHKGITQLENLEKVENLGHMTQLRCLYLANNVLPSLEGIQSLTSLWTLDVSHNALDSLAPLSGLTNLRSVSATHNRIAQPAGLAALQHATELQTLDLANNCIAQHDALEVILQLPVSLLRLLGNPIVSKTRNYRKVVVLAIPGLQSLDDMPCFEKDRRLALAHSRGGIEAEQLERKAIAAEAAETRERHRCAFNALMERAREEQAQAAKATNEQARDAQTQPKQALHQDEEPAQAPQEHSVPAQAHHYQGVVSDEVAADHVVGAAEDDVQASAQLPCEEVAASVASCMDGVGLHSEEQQRSTSDSKHELEAASSGSSTTVHGGELPSGSLILESPVTWPTEENGNLLYSTTIGTDVQPVTDLQSSIRNGIRGMDARSTMDASSRKHALWNTASYQELWRVALLAGKEQEDAVAAKMATPVHSDGANEATIPAFIESDHLDEAMNA